MGIAPNRKHCGTSTLSRRCRQSGGNIAWHLFASLRSAKIVTISGLRHRKSVNEAYRLIHMWAPIETIHALQLLDHKFPDPKVRAHAVHAIESCLTCNCAATCCS